LFSRRRNRRRRLRRRLLSAALVLVALCAGGVWVWLRASLPQAQGTITLVGLSQPVEVMRDAYGVPHIFANSELDLYFAIGFVHAQDRLAQMDFMRRSGQGRLAEIIGARALDGDRLMRALGIYALAEESYSALSEPVREALDAYAAGINAFLSTDIGPLPPEFLALGYQPEPWQPADTLVWARLMAILLSGNWRDELARLKLAKQISPEHVNDLWPDIVMTALHDLAPLPVGASNVFVLAGNRTSSGKPLMAHDPHLSLAAPGPWYLIHGESPTLRLAGATAPGVPFLILGHNFRVAWGATTTGIDAQDLVLERVTADTPDSYDTPSGPSKFISRDEQFVIRGEPARSQRIRSTRHGPVLTDIVPAVAEADTGGRLLALQATYLRSDDLTVESVFRLNHAENLEQAVAALRLWHSPQQVIALADTSGRIGFVAPARVPLRAAGDGRVPLPGWTGEADWRGFVPFEGLPQALDPTSGRIVHANNRLVPDSYPHLITRDWDSGYRAKRIHELLERSQPITKDQMAGFLLDSYSVFAREIARLLPEPAAGLARTAHSLLLQWDGQMQRDRPEPLIFTAWLRAFGRRLLADDLGTVAANFDLWRPEPIRRALTQGSPFCDDKTTPEVESCAAIAGLALEEAVAELVRAHGSGIGEWRWGKAHRAPFRHPLLQRVPVVADWFELELETDGDGYTVNRGGMRFADSERPYAHVHGAAYRAVFDLANLGRSLFALAPGQSGNPMSRHFRDLAQGWSRGATFELAGSQQERAALGDLRLRLLPP
jgi:penicillin G amidase